VSSAAEAEDLTARTFANALSSLDRYRARGGGFSAWLMTIAHNLLANWYRDRGRRPPPASLDEALDVPSGLPGPQSQLEQNELIQAIRGAVEQLGDEQQRLIRLKYVEGLTNAEIGRIMGRTEGAVKAMHHRTLRRLLPLLAGQVDA
jgi:RNA polymerase sigma-70 factor (ECF subfamily)